MTTKATTRKPTAAKKNKSAAGRPTKRTPEVEARILEALRKGNTRRAACAYGGIHEATLCEWVKEFPEFSEACTRAENKAEFGYIDVVQQAAENGDWKAAAWWLERRRKAEYSAKQEVEHSGKLQTEDVNETTQKKLARRIAGVLAGSGISEDRVLAD